MFVRPFLRFIVREGTLTLTDSKGRKTQFGTGGAPRVAARLLGRGTELRLLANLPLAVGEAYMEGRLVLEQGRLEDLFRLVAINYPNFRRHWLGRLTRLLSRQTNWVKQHNPMDRARRNVAHHYDLSRELYDLFLDEDRQYSCAYYRQPGASLEQAQEDKKRHLAAKLLLDRPGLTLLDIGSGWGGLGLYMAQVADCDVTGVTLSSEQHRLSQQRVEAARLESRVRFRLHDYRQEVGPYDRIVSVGMFEHVGRQDYLEFFTKLRDLLTDQGVAVLHTIGRFNQPGPINPFIRKYIFPGADLPTLSEILQPIERAGLLVTDIEVLRLHYAETLRHWHARFQANRAAVARLYDERFCRMWEFYLKSCEVGFRLQGLTVFQIQIAKSIEALPMTRDYIGDWERRHDREPSARAAE